MKRVAVHRGIFALASVVLGTTRLMFAQSAFTTFPVFPLVGSDGITASPTVTYTYYQPTYVGQGTLVPPTSANVNNGYVALNLLVGTKNASGGGTVPVDSSWEYSPANGVSVVGYYTANSSGGHLGATVTGVNPSGEVIGYSTHYNASPYNSSAGTDAWVSVPGAGNTSSPRLLPGLTGSNYGYTSSVSGYISKSQPAFISSSGVVTGETTRTNSAGYVLGSADWYYNPANSSTTEIGLNTLAPGTGTNPANYSGNAQMISGQGTYYNDTNVGVASTGIAAGTANDYLLTTTGTYTNGGLDGWVYSPSTGTTSIGLYQSGLTPVGYQGAAYSYGKSVSNSLGIYRYTNIEAVNASGQVGGSSYLYSASGVQEGGDAFVYTPGSNGSAGTYSLRGFTADGLDASPPAQTSYVEAGYYAGVRSSFLYYLNDAGQSVGTSALFSSTGSTTNGPAQAGNDIWFATASGSQTHVGLSGAIYSNPFLPQNTSQPNQYTRVSTPTQLTQSGLVGGFSDRYLQLGTTGGSHNGQDAFVYDSATGATYPVASSASLQDTNGLSNYFAQIVQLTENGYAVGTWGYTTGTNAFFWSPASGFIDLSYYAPTGTTLSNVFYTSNDAATLYADLTSGSNVTIAKISVAYVWANTGSGDWGTGSNWTNGMVPGSASSNALVVLGSSNSSGYGITAPSAVNLSSSTSVGSVTFSNTNAYSISTNNGSTLTISGVYLGGLTVTAGSHLITAPVSFGSNTAVALSTGTSLELDSVSGSGNLQIGGGGIAGNGKGTLLLGDVSDYTGNINLGSGYLVFRSGNLYNLNAEVAQGYDGGSWQGSSGITSSPAASDSTHLTALGIIQNSAVGATSGAALYSTFGGATGLIASDVLVRITYYGDANLDGKVDGSDYSRIDAGYASQGGSAPLSGWYNGDFNYDGSIDGSDYTLIDNTFNAQGASFGSASAAVTAQIAAIGSASAVPEPASLGIVTAGAALWLSRRSVSRTQKKQPWERAVE